jgi:hypothetical protein
MLEHGAFTLLLDTLYSTGTPLPTDRKLLYRICSAFTKRERNAVESVLSNFFFEKPTGFSNKRFEKEVSDSESRINAAQSNGKLGGRPPKQKPSGNPEHNPAESYPAPAPAPYKDLEPKTYPAPPALVPIALWLSFVEMRKKIRKPLTEGAAELIRRELSKLSEQGQDPIGILEQSVMNSWAGVFPLKGKNNAESFDERRRRKSREALGAIAVGAEEVVRKMERGLPDIRDNTDTGDGLRRSPGRPVTRAN